jgi:beta-barrel assembly-enhancing protease
LSVHLARAFQPLSGSNELLIASLKRDSIIDGEAESEGISKSNLYYDVSMSVRLFHLSRKLAIVLLICFVAGLAAPFIPFTGKAEAALSLDDEKKLGREFYEKLEKANVISQNERANTFLARLGERILAHSDKAPFEFKFSIIRSSAINAFATPGGYVYVNQGLITLVENEGELAGVLAHEIAHVNGRHISQILDRSQKVGLSALAAILAGAFLGGGGDVTAAVTGFAMATATTLSLKYSREQEEAADRMGISYLVDAGYSGSGMLDFLKIMRRYEYYSSAIPSYFLTHPGTDERTRYIDALLHTTYTKGGSESIIGNLERIQTLLLLDGKTSDATNLQHFQKILDDNPGNVDALYGMAVTQDKLGMVRESLDTYRKALGLAPDDADILRDLGIALFKQAQFQDAVLYLERASRLNERDPDTILYLGRTFEARGDIPKALGLYRKLEAKRLEDPEVLYTLAMAYGKVDQPGESHYYFGIYFKKKGKPESALFHFKAATKYFSPDTARAREITKQIESLKR